jgi:hypothetical protein
VIELKLEKCYRVRWTIIEKSFSFEWLSQSPRLLYEHA